MTQRPSAGPTVTPVERDDLFYFWLAGGAYTRLIESVQDLELPSLMAARGPLSAEAVASSLGLHLKRCQKWLLLLHRIGLLDRDLDGRYGASAMCRALWGDDGKGGYFYRDITAYCRTVNALPFNEVLKGMPLPEAVRWPPQTLDAARHLEGWMTVSAYDAIKSIEAIVPLDSVPTLLDVGGGEATMACHFVKAHPSLRITVFNLPASAYLARQKIASEGLTERVTVVDGNFLTDALQGGFDCVQFSRVLADWDPATCQMLVEKAYAALKPGGTLVICEPFADRNPDLTISWEFRYVFYDDFGVGTYKHIAEYQGMIRKAGFVDFTVDDRVVDTFYGVIRAKKPA